MLRSDYVALDLYLVLVFVKVFSHLGYAKELPWEATTTRLLLNLVH
jgi:hypothetical protein